MHDADPAPPRVLTGSETGRRLAAAARERLEILRGMRSSVSLPPSARLGRVVSSRAALPQEWKTDDAAGAKPLPHAGRDATSRAAVPR